MSLLETFPIESYDYDKSNDNTINFYNNSLLKKTKISKSIIQCISYLENEIEKNNLRYNGIYSPTDFGDIKMKVNDPSVQIALLHIGHQLIDKHCLTINELVYYFVSARYNFLERIIFKNTITIDKIQNSQYYKILKKYEQLSSFMELKKDNNREENSVIISCQYSNSLLRTIIDSVTNYVFKFYSLIIIPNPSLTGYIK